MLAPGLTLATVPSLLACWTTPTSLRALLLGLGCLALVLAGVALRWSAPLVVGAVVGALLVLRELAPYAAELPSWVVIGLSGTVLLVVGVTWESRMRDVRTAYAVRRQRAAGWTGPSAGEHRLHDLARRVDARLHGADRDVEQRGDVGVVQLLQVAQHQRLDERGMVDRQQLERLEEVEPAAGDHARGARVGGRREGRRSAARPSAA